MELDRDLVVVGPDEGREVIRVNGERTVIKTVGDPTRGAYAVRENTAPPGFTAVPLHIHRDAEEAFYVLAGRLAVLSGRRRAEAGPGSFVLIPRGTVHSLANLGAEPVRWLTLISPGERSEWVEATLGTTGLADTSDPEAAATVHRLVDAALGLSL